MIGSWWWVEISILIFHSDFYWTYFLRFQDRKCFLSNLVIIHWYDLPCLILLMHTFKTTEERSNVVMVVGCWFRCRATKNIYLFHGTTKQPIWKRIVSLPTLYLISPHKSWFSKAILLRSYICIKIADIYSCKLLYIYSADEEY